MKMDTQIPQTENKKSNKIVNEWQILEKKLHESLELSEKKKKQEKEAAKRNYQYFVCLSIPKKIETILIF